MDQLVSFIAQYLIIVPIAATIFLFARLDRKTRREYLILLVIGGLVAITLAKIGSYIYENPRPFLSDGVKPLFTPRDDNGFPSDHTLLAAFLAFAALVYVRKLGIALIIIAAILGWSRVAANVHHGVDIIGGFLCAGLAVLLVKSILEKTKQAKKEKKGAS